MRYPGLALFAVLCAYSAAFGDGIAKAKPPATAPAAAKPSPIERVDAQAIRIAHLEEALFSAQEKLLKSDAEQLRLQRKVLELEQEASAAEHAAVYDAAQKKYSIGENDTIDFKALTIERHPKPAAAPPVPPKAAKK